MIESDDAEEESRSSGLALSENLKVDFSINQEQRMDLLSRSVVPKEKDE